MNELSAQDIKNEVKKHIGIYFFLLFLTAVNFVVSKLHLLGDQTLLGVLAVATLQGGLVAAYFMHLISEKKFIIFILVVTFIFFLVLLFLPVLGFWGKLFGTIHVP